MTLRVPTLRYQICASSSSKCHVIDELPRQSAGQLTFNTLRALLLKISHNCTPRRACVATPANRPATACRF